MQVVELELLFCRKTAYPLLIELFAALLLVYQTPLFEPLLVGASKTWPFGPISMDCPAKLLSWLQPSAWRVEEL